MLLVVEDNGGHHGSEATFQYFPPSRFSFIQNQLNGMKGWGLMTKAERFKILISSQEQVYNPALRKLNQEKVKSAWLVYTMGSRPAWATQVLRLAQINQSINQSKSWHRSRISSMAERGCNITYKEVPWLAQPQAKTLWSLCSEYLNQYGMSL